MPASELLTAVASFSGGRPAPVTQATRRHRAEGVAFPRARLGCKPPCARKPGRPDRGGRGVCFCRQHRQLIKKLKKKQTYQHSLPNSRDRNLSNPVRRVINAENAESKAVLVVQSLSTERHSMSEGHENYRRTGNQEPNNEGTEGFPRPGNAGKLSWLPRKEPTSGLASSHVTLKQTQTPQQPLLNVNYQTATQREG